MRDRRLIRVNEEIQNELNVILRAGIQDPRFQAMTSCVRVETTTDLSFAKAFISVMGDDEQKQKTMEALESAKGHIRSTIASAINLRQTPEFTFILDDSLDHSFRINEALDSLTKEGDE
ncbi:MAG: 30S ribosome-binding factor RbfA [Defluviitaleaceae bacterium]|nr:30S ribosome-binding factor RbfA [Defluviitaleaceae bacterium]